MCVLSCLSCFSHWSILLRKVEFKRLKLLIAIKVALEVLEEHHFLVDRFWIFEEIKAANLVNEALHGLSITVLNRLLFAALYVVKVEHVRMQNNLRAIVEEYSIRVVRKFIPESVL